jgi:prolyl-tRNA editing enzyme YbaK/EbsC (Cys-tRNA(Pro) deacylase)
MSRKDHAPETPATVFLRQHGVNYTEHLYDYVEHGGTSVSSTRLGVDEHQVLKTLVMQDQGAQPCWS